MGKAIMITSFKGGVGKSTVAVNLAAGLAADKHKVLIIDLDSSSGSVDLFMGCEHFALYDFCDVVKKRVSITDAVYTKKSGDEKKKGGYSLDILKSPPSYEIGPADNPASVSVSVEESVGGFIEEARNIYDFIIFDCPSGKFDLFEALAKKTDQIFVVTLHSAASVRSAEKLASYLSEITGGKGENVRLIVNGFNPRGVTRGLNLGIVDIIEWSKIKLIGLVEINDRIRDFQEEGKTIYDVGVKNKSAENKRTKAAFDDIIGRTLDNNIILNRKYDGFKTRSLYFKKEKK